MKQLVDQMADSEAAFWKFTCSTPEGVPAWKSEDRVTVIGDACHAMTPGGGMGANTALRDSALLGRLLAGGFKEGLMAAYEEEMRGYASEAVRISYGASKMALGIEITATTATL